MPETIDNHPCGWRDGTRVRIVFTHEFQDMVLVGGMAAEINRFQSVHLQSGKKVQFLIEGLTLGAKPIR